MLLRDRGVCLMSRPDFKKLPGDPQCGNMFTERGEQCDCGKPEECGDPCCDPATCKFKRGAECSSTELCCEDCKFLPMGTVCRPLMGECDLEEYCYGNSSICPDNVFLKDGYECKDGASYCSAGACQSPDIMCEELWGSGAQSAEDICYSNLNAKGDEFGHCGKDQYDQFQNCQPWNVKCGKLQCKGGQPHPLQMETADVKTINVLVMHTNYLCKTAQIVMTDFRSSDMVQDGTKCGGHKACQGGKCVDIGQFGVEPCERRCHGRGVCNYYDHCHCEMGWAPPFCDVEGAAGSFESGPLVEIPGRADSNSIGTTILVPVLTMSVITYIATKFLRKKITCTRPSTNAAAAELTCHASDL
ncbi:disintegrin and metalloproteinase domain-containing protein 12-like isoform X2 [Chiloscyllium punctatum]|uniref:disintegrin and metalloproteinase domain-containing protein 12-like isoform X2 n=1 Tax=Chiloscyllium punctatum TaxID=137246 RepID=UPI003B63C104